MCTVYLTRSLIVKFTGGELSAIVDPDNLTVLVAPVGFEPTASLVLSQSGLPVA